VFRRSLALAGAIALVFAALASAADVRIRVEGKTRTIFGATDTRISAGNALEALEGAGRAGEFYYHVTQTSFGPYVDQIGLYPAVDVSGWAYKVNGVSPPVGADQFVLHPGDRVLWYWATFGPAGGPPTLVLQRAGKQRCYRVYKQDDTGARTPALGAVLHVGSRRVVKTQGSTQAAVGCVGRHRGLLVRATLEGSIRSNALP
jgi:Domain of unknown function (DUF4430)